MDAGALKIILRAEESVQTDRSKSNGGTERQMSFHGHVPTARHRGAGVPSRGTGR